MNEVASSSRLSDTAMPSGVCDMGGGEDTLKRVSPGSTTVVDIDEDCSLLPFVVLVRFIANSLIRSCCSRKASPITDGPEVKVVDGFSHADFSSLVEGTLPSLFVISGVVLGYLSEGGEPVDIRSC